MDADILLRSGAPLDSARVALLLVHGRGASAEDILQLGEALAEGMEGVALLAPRSPMGNTWYPYPFMSPMEQNEPHLSHALNRLAETFVLSAASVPVHRTVLVGFSQGACLATEFAARNANHFGGVVGFSGGLIGPPGTPRNYTGSMSGTPVFLGCSDVDPHIPKERVQETAQVLGDLGAQVTMRLYEGMGHTVNEDELEFVRAMIKGLDL